MHLIFPPKSKSFQHFNFTILIRNPQHLSYCISCFSKSPSLNLHPFDFRRIKLLFFDWRWERKGVDGSRR
ncbi:hypothetical protein ES332_A05G375900v1 [Gossypium tomentosum]|uniref:Uncharacterized protein n=1 Tax=Gossypium tomentosum TaxID=34277 RepID=A0A5D2QNT3_GOSTO|nr:hypothetical protein ES332_A05G375900v1 [Gossypium tomentosum]